MRLVLDAIDLRLLAALQRDASLSSTELAEQIGLSQAPCWRRVKRLEEAGLVRRRVALLDRKLLGLELMVFAQVKLATHGRDTLPGFEEATRALFAGDREGFAERIAGWPTDVREHAAWLASDGES